MVTFSSDQYRQHLLKRVPVNDGARIAKGSVKRESSLHKEIMDHCDKQWPRWKYIHARMDCESTIEKGAQDFTIFMPQGRVLCVECKSSTGKRTPEQLSWKKEMQMLGHTVFEVRSMEEFLGVVRDVEGGRV